MSGSTNQRLRTVQSVGRISYPRWTENNFKKSDPRFFSVTFFSYISSITIENMKLEQLVKILRTGSKLAIDTVISNRAEVQQSQLEFLMKMDGHGVQITKDDMGHATWYYIYADGKLVGSQFYWNDGEYDAAGNHSLYDEYGMPHGMLAQ